MKAYLLAALALFTGQANGQYWRALGLGVIGASEVQCLYGDSVSGRLLAGGTFQKIMNLQDTVLGLGQAAWNGERWDSLAHRIQPLVGNSANQTFWFLRFQDELYACGGFTFQTGEDDYNSAFARLNVATNMWEALECENSVMSGLSTLVPKTPTSTLYATGYRGGLCGNPEACVFRYDGTAFHPWEPFEQIPYYNNNYVGVIFDYRGKTYMSGLFRDPLSEGYLSFARYDGTNWEHVPGWNTLSPIKEISIHNDTLYVAGAFRYATGGPGDLVARFNGETWDDMGGGLLLEEAPMSSAALELTWFHDELWVGGEFSRAGGIPAESLAKWNGRQWCSLPADFASDFFPTAKVNGITVWRDSLYICGGFSSINGEPVYDVARWIGGDATLACSAPVGLPEITGLPRLILTPNPATTEIVLSTTPAGAATVRITDALGRIVGHQRLTGTVVQVHALAPGSYVTQVFDARDQIVGLARFVKE